MSERDENGRFVDYELSAEAFRTRRRGQSCHCGNDLPGRCPGPDSCPYADREDDLGEDNYLEDHDMGAR